MSAKLIDGEQLANSIRERIKNEIVELNIKYNKVPLLAAVQVGENPSSAVYIKNQQKFCEEVGLGYKLHSLPAETTKVELIDYITKLNNDDNTTGIILQMPLPKEINAREVQTCISPAKDVEGLNPVNIGQLVYGNPVVAPCTAMAVFELLKSLPEPIKGKEAVIVGHSEIVGKPVTLFLLSSMLESATPTVCHIATKDLKFHTKRAEILIVAVGKPGLINGDMVKEGAIVIDVGINRVPILDEKGQPVLNEKGKPKMKTVGDVNFDEVKEKVAYITPVPGGVGPVTTVMLLKNTLALFKQKIGN